MEYKIINNYIFFSVLAAGLLVFTAHAERSEGYLTDSSIRVLRHDRRSSRFRLPQGEGVSARERWGLLFKGDLFRQLDQGEENLVAYKKLPLCKKSEVRLSKIFHYTPGTERFDILYYSGESANQRRRVNNYQGHSEIYNPSLERNPVSKQLEPWQVFARFVQIECLPTRFHFTFIGSQRYIEYRMGEAAWENFKPRK